MAELQRIDTVVQFTDGSDTVWTDPAVAVPSGAIVIDTVNKVIKEGDGVSLFSELPVCLDYNFTGGSSGAAPLDGGDSDDVTISINSKYDNSGVKLADILTSIAARQSVEGSQDVRFTALDNGNVVGSLGAAGNDLICKCVGG